MQPCLRHTLLAAATACLLVACASTPQTSTTQAKQAATATAGSTEAATVNLASASGSLVSGTLRIVSSGKGVHITGEIGGLAPNSGHAFHFHEKGDCSAADASSALGHFNPSHSPHGRAGAGPHHAGDMDNITANADGVARIDIQDNDVSLHRGAPNDITGRAVIVHAGVDDYTSQPAGNAGARVACGVIEPEM